MGEKKEPVVKAASEDESEKFGAEMYEESARAMRQVGARVVLSVGAAILIWLAGRLIFVPIAQGLTEQLLGYPVAGIVGAIIAVALAVIIFTVFIDIRRLTGGLAGIMAYHFGKASGEVQKAEYDNYRTALDGVLYVVIVSLSYLLFVDYLATIHTAIPAILLILIVIWAIFALYRSTRAVANIVGKYTSKAANELEKQAKKK
ncbi:MAG: hypothetical protein OEY22_07495 [Candidatus Bathyarchaeota archaeon]|nr:hypothetical protein [Candidatus Bathyarchaeota archaeon]